MAEPLVRIENVSKLFGTFQAVKDVTLEIEKGEVFALLGGSGCGKTTLLRMLAGFEEPSAGRIVIDGQDMARVPPWERPVHMMFQSYALFPHMTVAANVGYGLKHEPMSRAQRQARVDEMLDLVQLTPFATRKPHQISGGQRQRVALARALARQPKLLLLDEPLAALDKKLREHTQFELMSIQERTGVTFIVVTHDQEEAMTLADRLAVMDRGEVKQVGAPAYVYEHPASRFVANFLGSVNLFPATVAGEDADGVTLDVPDLGGRVLTTEGRGLAPGTAVTLAVRPEKLAIHRDQPHDRNVFPAEVKDLAYFGKDSLYRVTLPGGMVVNVHAVNRSRAGETRPDWYDRVWIAFDPAAAIVLTE